MNSQTTAAPGNRPVGQRRARPVLAHPVALTTRLPGGSRGEQGVDVVGFAGQHVATSASQSRLVHARGGGRAAPACGRSDDRGGGRCGRRAAAERRAGPAGPEDAEAGRRSGEVVAGQELVQRELDRDRILRAAGQSLTPLGDAGDLAERTASPSQLVEQVRAAAYTPILCVVTSAPRGTGRRGCLAPALGRPAPWARPIGTSCPIRVRVGSPRVSAHAGRPS